MAAFRLNRVHRAISELTPRGRRGAGERLVRGLRDVLLSPELLPGMDAGDPAPPAQPAAALAMGVA